MLMVVVMLRFMFMATAFMVMEFMMMIIVMVFATMSHNISFFCCKGTATVLQLGCKVDNKQKKRLTNTVARRFL